MSMLPEILKSIFIGRVKDAISKENLNPIESPTTGVAYTTSGALAYLVANPPGTEYDIALQFATALVAVIAFFWKEHKEKDKEDK